MKTYDFDQIIDRSGTQSIKFEERPVGAPMDTIPMWVADMDFPCADPILEALHRRVDRQIFGYSNCDAPAYQKAVTGWYQKRFGWTVDAENLFFSPGVVPALSGLVSLLAKEGEGVVIQEPVYHPFRSVTEANRRVVVNVPLKNADGDYSMDYAALDAALSKPENRVIILCSPHNPVGRVWSRDELCRLVEIARKYDKWIISDEIHSDLLRRGVVHTPLAKACPDYTHRMVVCTAPSKTFNLAGIQASNIVIYNKELQQRWMALNPWGPWHPNAFAVAATVAAYEEGEEWLEQLLDYLDGNMDFACDYIRENLPKARVTRPQGTYLLWVDLRGYIADRRALEEVMQNRAKLALDEGYIFGESGAGFERINMASPRSVIRTALEQMKQALES